MRKHVSVASYCLKKRQTIPAERNNDVSLVPLRNTEVRLRLGKMQAKALLFRSACTNFAPTNRIYRGATDRRRHTFATAA